jgi:hypothetical protein
MIFTANKMELINGCTDKSAKKQIGTILALHKWR